MDLAGSLNATRKTLRETGLKKQFSDSRRAKAAVSSLLTNQREADLVALGWRSRCAGIGQFGADSTASHQANESPHLVGCLYARRDPVREMAPDPFFRLGTSSPPLLVQLSG